MKKIILILAVAATNLLLPSKSKGQSVYIITEVLSTGVPLFDSVYVTSPTGAVTSYSIPQLTNVAGHDAALSLIINGITTQGYVISDYSVLRPTYHPTLSRVTHRWFLKKP